MRSIILLWLGLGAGVTFADIPYLRQGELSRSVELDGTKFEIYRDRNNRDHLYVLPKSLKIAVDGEGVPKVSVILVREALEEGQGTNGYGYAMVSVTVGPRMTSDIYDGLRRRIAEAFPDLEIAGISPVSFKPGTTEIGFQVLDSGAPEVRVPVSAPHAIGAEIPLIVPITREHGEFIRQIGASDSRELGISISYRANVAFEIAPTVVSVRANNSQIYDYFQQRRKIGGGFWILNWSDERNKIRERFEREDHLAGEITYGDIRLVETMGGAEYLKGLLEAEKNRIIDLVANISVARTPQDAPMDGYKEREGRTTVFGPNYYWTYQSYGSLGFSNVDLSRRTDVNHSSSVTFRGSHELPVTLAPESIPLPPDVVTVVGLDNAFYVRELLAGQPLHHDWIWRQSVGGVSHAMLEVVIGEGTDTETEQIVRFNFDRSNPHTQTVAFWRNARFRRVDLGRSTLIEPVLPRLRVRGEVTTTQGGRIKVPDNPDEYIEVSRTTSPFEPQTVRLADFFGIAEIEGQTVFDSINPDCGGALRVHIETSGQRTEVLTLRRKNPNAFLPFVVRPDGGSGLPGDTVMRVEFIGRGRSGLGDSVDIGGLTDVMPTIGDLPDDWEAMGCGIGG